MLVIFLCLILGGLIGMCGVDDGLVVESRLDLRNDGELLETEVFEVGAIDLGVAYECPELRYKVRDDYVFDEMECDLFQNRGGDESGAYYFFTPENRNDLDAFDVVYEDRDVRVYDFVEFDELEGHIFGEIYFKICDDRRSDYFLLEFDYVVNEDLEVEIDESGHMVLEEFVDLCRSLELADE